ncbi:phage/plasmid primase, P4 family [Phenylobacterium sp.]|uniref:phage/plasmid primase, P4 family n=1 Tax=Phenylobacterium sp. TaxID=1871053 RepID=UPI002730D938|nr:phage/plasmid primase, P4 family [Phenylobacterium sp.]MDP2214097.1 phage/plasmid primase, P4 family [Phenylobacterium sp.]
MFSENAPKYWAVNLPAMPLRPQAKIPALTAWQAFCAKMPTEEQQADWLASYPDGNIGLPLGPQAGIIALDLDSEDPRVQAILDKIMPATPWKRVGKKGAVYAFKYNGERTYRIKDADNKTILEVLSRGAQIVLPPSIHPDTMQPYRANAELVDVYDRLPALPSNFETTVRQSLIDAAFQLTSRGATKVTEWVPSGGRDSALVAMAGLCARSVLRKERTLLEAINEMEGWVATYTEKVVGDELDPAKGRQKVLEFLRRDLVGNGKALAAGWDAGMSAEDAAEMRAFFGEDAEEWTAAQIMDHLQAKFIEIPKDNVPGRQAMIEEVLARVARSEHLNHIDEDMILGFIQNGSGRMVTVAALRKHLKDLQGGEILGTDHTEIAQALLRTLEVEGEIRFVNGRFYQWFGSYWREMEQSEIFKRLAEEYGDLSAARKFYDHKGIVQVMEKLARADLRSDEVVGINFANGYLSDDMQLLNHDRRFGATYVLPYRYVPNEGAPSIFLSFLDQCWGEDEDYLDKVQALREMIAATLFGRATNYHRAFCLYGVAGSGKTTLMNIVLGLLPSSSTCSIPPQDWGDRFLPTQMAGRLVNVCGELSETQMIPGNQFKQIVEGAEMAGQNKGQPIFQFRPLCAQWFASNHLPRSRDTSAGFNRRWLILHFSKPCPRDQLRRDLDKEILAEEREAIVAWAVPAIQDLIRQQDFTLPQSHLEQISEVATQNNSVRFFLSAAEGVRVGGESTVSERDLYARYHIWCKLQANAQPVQLKRFRMLMQDLQSDLGFQLQVDRSTGTELVTYSNISIMEKKAQMK